MPFHPQVFQSIVSGPYLQLLQLAFPVTIKAAALDAALGSSAKPAGTKSTSSTRPLAAVQASSNASGPAAVPAALISGCQQLLDMVLFHESHIHGFAEACTLMTSQQLKATTESGDGAAEAQQEAEAKEVDSDDEAAVKVPAPKAKAAPAEARSYHMQLFQVGGLHCSMLHWGDCCLVVQ